MVKGPFSNLELPQVFKKALIPRKSNRFWFTSKFAEAYSDLIKISIFCECLETSGLESVLGIEKEKLV
jgi:hypothetical protein